VLLLKLTTKKRKFPHEPATFQAWLLGIADHVVKDTVKRHQRAKRGGEFHRVHRAKPTPSRSVADLVELLSADGHSPSYSVMGHEAVRAVQAAIASLPEDYGQAVQLRLLEGKSLEETAATMNCSPRAVQGLIDRAKNKMRAALGRLSNYR
jgi:RNA polymerase sigma factor (sigma-70 family)